MTSQQPPRVLVVDDDAALIRMVRLSFLSEGFSVVTAGDGIQGLEVMAAESVDAIVLDLLMPRMDGRSFYRELRARGSDVPVVIISAYGAASARDELQANAALSKPFDPDVLISEVRRLIASRSVTEDRTSYGPYFRAWRSD